MSKTKNQSSVYGLLLKYGNKKINRNTGIFSLPAGSEYTCSVTCPGCYARRDQNLYPGVLAYRHRMMEYTKSDTFVEMMNMEIRSRKTTDNVRIHESGDFYSQQYLDKWIKIMKANPDKLFYAYTKRNDINFDEATALDNFNLIRSYVWAGGKKRINFAPKEVIKEIYHQMKAEGQNVMICNPEKICMKECSFCLNKGNIPLFIKH